MWRRGEELGFVQGRCKATNLCAYCRILGVVETAEMLYLDAMEHAPQLLLTLTAREHLTRPDTYRHLEKVRRSVRKRWPAFEYFVQVEFQKRGALHLHLLVKGVAPGDAEALKERVCGVWCARVDAEPPGQDCRPINAAQAVVRYLQKELVHGLKSEQAPPIGWRGHRTSQSRGYLVRPASVMRQEAKAALRLKRAIHKVREQMPEADGDLVEELTSWLLDIEAQKRWTLAAQHHGALVELVDGRLVALDGKALRLWKQLEAAREAAQPPPRPG